jgi:hypothetical protein
MPKNKNQNSNSLIKTSIPKKKKGKVKIHGHGGFFTTAKKIATKHLWPALKMGGKEVLKQLSKTVLGHGDYTTHGGASATKSMLTFGSSDAIISHTEYVGDVSGFTTFNVQSYLVNPTSTALFPWLSNIASSYQEWELSGLIFEYRPTSSMLVSGTNPAMGAIIFAANYDTDAPNFTSKFQMENFDGALSIRPDQYGYFGIECDKKKNVSDKLFTTTTSDNKFSDICNFQLATLGQQSQGVIGELWVSYKIRLLKPKMSLTSSARDFLQTCCIGSSITPANPLAGGYSFVGRGRFTGITNTSNYITFPIRPASGLYILVEYLWNVTGASGVLSYGWGGSLSGCVNAVNMFPSNSGFTNYIQGSYAGTGILQMNAVYITDAGLVSGCNAPASLTVNPGSTMTWTPGSSTFHNLMLIPLCSSSDIGYFTSNNKINDNVNLIKQAIREMLVGELKEPENTYEMLEDTPLSGPSPIVPAPTPTGPPINPDPPRAPGFTDRGPGILHLLKSLT